MADPTRPLLPITVTLSYIASILEHTFVSRAIEVHGNAWPTAEALEDKKTFLEDNCQFPRKVMIS
jgi:hypothetical protein